MVKLPRCIFPPRAITAGWVRLTSKDDHRRMVSARDMCSQQVSVNLTVVLEYGTEYKTMCKKCWTKLLEAES